MHGEVVRFAVTHKYGTHEEGQVSAALEAKVNALAAALVTQVEQEARAIKQLEAALETAERELAFERPMREAAKAEIIELQAALATADEAHAKLTAVYDRFVDGRKAELAAKDTALAEAQKSLAVAVREVNAIERVRVEAQKESERVETKE